MKAYVYILNGKVVINPEPMPEQQATIFAFDEITHQRALKEWEYNCKECLPVAGFEQLYLISEDGQVYGLKKQKLLGLQTSRGYKQAWLSKNNVCRGMSVHRLVATAFIPNPNNLPEVNHKNGIKSDNRKENLEWCTHQGNMDHAKNHGLMAIGEKSGQSKLNEFQVRVIRNCNDLSNRALGRIFGISHNAVGDIKHRKKWKHI